jgi:hypothetical protein
LLTITIQDIIHYRVFHLKHEVLGAVFCLGVQVEPTRLSPVDRASLCLLAHLKTNRIQPLKLCFLSKDRMMDNVQNYGTFINIPSSEMYRSSLTGILFACLPCESYGNPCSHAFLQVISKACSSTPANVIF